MKIDRKNILLLAATALMLLISYHAAIKKTLVQRRSFIANTEKGRAEQSLPQELARLRQRQQLLDARLGELNLGDRSMHNNLLKFLNTQVAQHRVVLIDFEAPHTVTDDKGSQETYVFSLQGGYTDILKVMQALENNGGFGAVNHVGFEKRTEYRSKRKFLTAQVFLQQHR